MTSSDSNRERLALWSRMVGFGIVFVLLQAAWSALEGSAVWRTWMESMNVSAAAAFIGVLAPEAGAYADGTRIRAIGGGLNLIEGCDGVELLWLMTAAFAVAPLAWPWRLAGWIAGLVLAWLLNVTRIAALFFTWRADQDWFDWLHNYIGPVGLVLLLVLYVQWVMARAPAPVKESATWFR